MRTSQACEKKGGQRMKIGGSLLGFFLPFFVFLCVICQAFAINLYEQYGTMPGHVVVD